MLKHTDPLQRTQRINAAKIKLHNDFYLEETATKGAAGMKACAPATRAITAQAVFMII
jgi:hypothetical protein